MDIMTTEFEVKCEIDVGMEASHLCYYTIQVGRFKAAIIFYWKEAVCLWWQKRKIGPQRKVIKNSSCV